MAVVWCDFVCPQCGHRTNQRESANVYCGRILEHDRRKHVQMRKK